MTERRKIAAILAADVVGFSRMTSADEDRTLAQLRALRADVVDPIVASQNGRVFKRTGDGALVEFRSVVEAVRTAIAVQNAMIERNVGEPEDQRIVFRIGVHLGDVVEESDGDLMGDGVNIAARLEGIAEPGGICLSEDAYRHVKGRVDLAAKDLGPVALKNIAEPIRAYSLQVGTTAARPNKKRSMLGPFVAGIVALAIFVSATGYFLAANRSASNVASHPAAAHLSIVVLPFANLSNDPAQDYFADGITENLTTDLSRIRDSFVIARNTAFTFKGKNVDAKDIGKDLGVRYVLEGSVQRDQSRVRVNAQLIDAETGAHLWADRFEEDVADLFKLQDEIVARLANALNYELTSAEAAAVAHSNNPDVIDLVMRGNAASWQFLRDPSKSANNSVRALFEQALSIDPDNADALAGDANAYLTQYAYFGPAPEIDYAAKVLGQADRSIALARDNGYPYRVKSGYFLIISHQPEDALRAADASLIINPNSPYAYAARASAETYLRRFEQAKSDVEQAMRLSPRDPGLGSWHNFMADAELGLRHFDAAIDESTKAIDAGYRVFYSYLNLAAARALKGDIDDAKTALAEACRLNPKLSVKWLGERKPILRPAFDALRKAGLPEE